MGHTAAQGEALEESSSLPPRREYNLKCDPNSFMRGLRRIESKNTGFAVVETPVGCDRWVLGVGAYRPERSCFAASCSSRRRPVKVFHIA
jgi:hypothetical protein